MKSVSLEIESIRIDGGTQMRERIHTDTVDDYAESYSDGANMPPLDVFFDGKEHWLGNGFHRYHAVRKIGRKEVECFIHKGTLREAILFAAGCNDTNGLRRSPADKHAAVTKLLNDPEWVKRSDIWIAETTRVSRDLVASCRKRHTLEKLPKVPACGSATSVKSAERRTGRDGKKYPSKRKSKKEIAEALRVPPIDADEPPVRKTELAATSSKPVTVSREKDYGDFFDEEHEWVRIIADLVARMRKRHSKANIDKGRYVHELNTMANEIAEAIDEAEAVA